MPSRWHLRQRQRYACQCIPRPCCCETLRVNDRGGNPHPKIREHSNCIGFHLRAGKEKGWKYLQRKSAIPGGLSKTQQNLATCCYAIDLVQAGPSQPAHQSWDSETSDQIFTVWYRCIQRPPIQQDNNVIENSCLPYLLFTAVVLCKVHPVEFREGKWTGMKVYFGFTVAGDRSAVDAAKKIVGILDEMGHEVLTRHLVEENAWEADRSISPREVYLRDMKWLEKCDMFIAEVSGSSFGLGFETGYLLGATTKKVVLFYRREVESKISLLITGVTHPNCTLVPYSDLSAVEVWIRSNLAE